MDTRVFWVFEESNFDAYDRERFAPVLEAGLAHNGLTSEDVLAVTQDFGLWAVCAQGVFYADLRGMLKKRIEVAGLIPYSRIMEVQVEPSGPRTMKLVIRDDDSRALAEIKFGAAEEERCRHIVETMKEPWSQAQ